MLLRLRDLNREGCKHIKRPERQYLDDDLLEYDEEYLLRLLGLRLLLDPELLLLLPLE